MSVAKTRTLVPFWAASACSSSSIATVYASSPVAQPVTQARSGWLGVFSRTGRDHLLFEELPGLGVAKEAGHGDQQVPEQGVDLGRVGLQEPQVILHVGEVPESHPALDASDQGPLLVEFEVMVIPGVQHRQDGAEVFGELLVGRSGCGGAAHVGMLDESEEDLGHPLHGQDVVDQSRGDRAAGHAVVGCRLRVLGQGQAAVSLDGLQAVRALGAGPGEDDADGLLVAVLGQGVEEEVNGYPPPAALDGAVRWSTSSLMVMYSSGGMT